ncbi:serpin family protein [Methanosarcina sp. T3]|uniref:serpin family protein n=1 Tax=Methanosarcina sp. T3 TaxID=3439062 RepID=UPI003F872ADD
MGKMKILFLVFILTLLFTGCVEDTTAIEKNTDVVEENTDVVEENTDVVEEDTTVIPESTINAGSVEDYDIAAANNAFAFDMYSQLMQLETGEYENIFFSPHSISAAMAICYEGAEDTTKEQISKVFYFPYNKTVLKVRMGQCTESSVKYD